MGTIKRNTKYIELMALTDSSAFGAGEFIKVWKDEECNCWLTTDSNGKKWQMLISNMRNDNFYKIIRQSSGVDASSNTIYSLMEMDSDYQTVIWEMIVDAIQKSLDDCGQFFNTKELHDYISQNYI